MSVIEEVKAEVARIKSAYEAERNSLEADLQAVLADLKGVAVATAPKAPESTEPTA